MDPGRWRCEYCGRLSSLNFAAAMEQKIRTRMRVPYDIPIVRCDHCYGRANWMHIASEIQVNRALKAPHEFLIWNVENMFKQLQMRDLGHQLRLLEPAEGLYATALGWVKTIHRWAPGLRPGESCLSPQGPSKRVLAEIKDIVGAASGGARYWSNVRMLG